jgi:hypothetical protein
LHQYRRARDPKVVGIVSDDASFGPAIRLNAGSDLQCDVIVMAFYLRGWRSS